MADLSPTQQDSAWLAALSAPPNHLNGHKPDLHCYRPLAASSVQVGRVRIANYASRLIAFIEKAVRDDTLPATQRTRAAIDELTARVDRPFVDVAVTEEDVDPTQRTPVTKSTRGDLRFLPLRENVVAFAGTPSATEMEAEIARTKAGNPNYDELALSIAFTRAGDRGPAVVFVHGVPTNRKQWWEVQSIVSRFARTLSFDLLGMGESSKPLDFPDVAWDWQFDLFYWQFMIKKFFPGERVMLVADDWGSGPNSHYAAALGKDDTFAFVQLDPIAFDGYPVAEIQAFGRLHGFNLDFREISKMPNCADKAAKAKQLVTTFRMAVGSADQTMVQIFKTMVHHPDRVFNQYSLRTPKETYVDTDYERRGATSLTLRLNYHAIRVMAARAARLSPDLLFPYDADENPYGVRYSRIEVPTMIMWGEFDNMMPPNQLYRFRFVLGNAESVHLHKIPSAGHFAATDRPLEVAEQIINFLVEIVGYDEATAQRRVLRDISKPIRQTLSATEARRRGRTTIPIPVRVADVFIGLTGLWKGDEPFLLKSARQMLLPVIGKEKGDQKKEFCSAPMVVSKADPETAASSALEQLQFL